MNITIYEYSMGSNYKIFLSIFDCINWSYSGLKDPRDLYQNKWNQMHEVVMHGNDTVEE